MSNIKDSWYAYFKAQQNVLEIKKEILQKFKLDNVLDLDIAMNDYSNWYADEDRKIARIMGFGPEVELRKKSFCENLVALYLHDPSSIDDQPYSWVLLVLAEKEIDPPAK